MLLDYKLKGPRLKLPPWQVFISASATTPVNSSMMSKYTDRTLLTGRSDDEDDHPPAYAEAKKIKSLAVRTHGCLSVCLYLPLLWVHQHGMISPLSCVPC